MGIRGQNEKIEKIEKNEKNQKDEKDENGNLADCNGEKKSSCGLVARRKNSHWVDDRNDPILDFTKVKVMILIMVGLIIMIGMILS